MISTDPNRPSRQRMVDEQIRARGITDKRVLSAMVEIPREQFVSSNEAAGAFSDRALTIGCGQTISQPFMVASMTEELRVESEHRVLEIGTGSGYQTAVLARLCNYVYTVERIDTLQQSARRRLESLGITNVVYHIGDGSVGWSEHAPYDRILVTAGAPEVPRSLVEQLTDGGRLVIPVGQAVEQTLTIIERVGSKTKELPRYPCRFVKLFGKEGWPDND